MIPAKLIAGGFPELIEAVYSDAVRRNNASTDVGKGKFEKNLEVVGLDGPLPDELSSTIFQAQQIRNIWAHNAGKADRSFLRLFQIYL